MRTFLMGTLAFATLAPDPASAQSDVTALNPGFSYNYLEVGYARIDFDADSDEADALFLNFSAGALPGTAEGSIAEHLYLFAGYTTYTINDTPVGDLDTDLFRIGLGVRWPLASATDAYVQAAWLHAEIDFPGGGGDAEGSQADLGLRHLLLDQQGWAMDVELEARISRVDFEDVASEMGFMAGARLYLSEAISLGAFFEHFEESDTLGGGLRAQW